MFKWMFLPLKRYAEFSGRSRRKEYWWWFLFTQGLSLIIMAPLMAGVLKVILTVVETLPDELSEEEIEALFMGSFHPALFLATVGLLSLVTLAFLVPNLALNLRRFRDCGIEAKWFWILLVACFVPFFFGIPGLAIWIIAGFVPGTPGPNQFGENPRDEEVPSSPTDEPVPPPPAIWPAS